VVDSAPIGQALADAIAGALGHHEHSMTTKFVAVVEVIGEDGSRALWTFSSPDATPWDSKGMLLQALDEELAATLRAD
jgi:hypothetical protein